MPLPCVVLGGGLGTRMRPWTEHVPKVLLPVAGVPFAVRQIRWLASQGVLDVIYSVGHLGAVVRSELARHDLHGCRVTFVDDGERLVGTGGAVRRCVENARLAGAFFVLYGDAYVQLELADLAHAVREAPWADAVMAVFRNAGAWDTSNACFDGTRVRRYDKREPDPASAGMDYIDYGISVLRADVVEQRIAPAQVADLADFFATLSAEGRLAGFEVEERFFEIGSPAGLAALEQHVAARQ